MGGRGTTGADGPGRGGSDHRIRGAVEAGRPAARKGRGEGQQGHNGGSGGKEAACERRRGHERQKGETSGRVSTAALGAVARGGSGRREAAASVEGGTSGRSRRRRSRRSRGHSRWLRRRRVGRSQARNAAAARWTEPKARRAVARRGRLGPACVVGEVTLARTEPKARRAVARRRRLGPACVVREVTSASRRITAAVWRGSCASGLGVHALEDVHRVGITAVSPSKQLFQLGKERPAGLDLVKSVIAVKVGVCEGLAVPRAKRETKAAALQSDDGFVQ